MDFSVPSPSKRLKQGSVFLENHPPRPSWELAVYLRCTLGFGVYSEAFPVFVPACGASSQTRFLLKRLHRPTQNRKNFISPSPPSAKNRSPSWEGVPCRRCQKNALVSHTSAFRSVPFAPARPAENDGSVREPGGRRHFASAAARASSIFAGGTEIGPP